MTITQEIMSADDWCRKYGNQYALTESIAALNQRDAARVSAWQPIETAPKDGTMILLYLDGNVCQGLWHTGLIYGSGDKKGEDAPDSWVMGWNWEKPIVTNAITHWQPLPPPPEQTP